MSNVFPLDFANAGLSQIPLKIDGSKGPSIPEWTPYKTDPALPEELSAWSQIYGAAGIVCGKVSGNLEVIDIDDPLVAANYMDICESEHTELIQALPIVQTPSRGLHIYYRCKTIAGNKKLARTESDDTLIETRGEGGYVVSPLSSPLVHDTKKPYRLIQGSLTDIPTITTDARDFLLNVARTFDEKPPSNKLTPARTTPRDGKLRPGDDFNNKTTWESILEPHGWQLVRTTREGVDHWRRPGKDDTGISATTCHKQRDILYVFTSNGKPFEAFTGYEKFTAYTLLNHNGDFTAATRALGADGYGDQEKFSHEQTDAARLKYGAHIDSDLCNARRLIAQHGDDMRFVFGKGWYVWTGTHWSNDELDAVQRAKLTASSIRNEMGEDPEINKMLRKWAKDSENRQRIMNMLKLAESEPEIRARFKDFDCNKDELNVSNGIVDLRTGTLRDHDRSAMHSKIIELNYNPKKPARLQTWYDTLDLAVAHPETGEPDRNLQEYLQCAFGYTLTGHTYEDAVFFAYGITAENGKSSILEPMLVAMGPYATGIDKSCIMANTQKSAIRADIAKLPGTRYVSASELDEYDRLDEAQFKRMTGDALTARNPYEREVTYMPQFKLWLMSNSQPRVSTGGHGLWRRMHVIPFDVRIKNANKRVKELLKTDREALETILAWAIDGARKWYEDGLPENERVKAATGMYANEQDTLQQFIDDYADVAEYNMVVQDEFFSKYRQYCEDNNAGKPRKRGVTNELKRKGIDVKRSTNGVRMYKGIILR